MAIDPSLLLSGGSGGLDLQTSASAYSDATTGPIRISGDFVTGEGFPWGTIIVAGLAIVAVVAVMRKG